MKTYEVFVNKKAHNVRVAKKDEGLFLVDVNGKNVEVKMTTSNNGRRVFLEINGGRTVQAEILEAYSGLWQIKIGGKTFEVQQPTFASKLGDVKFEPAASTPLKKSAASTVSIKDAVLAPIAGRIVALKVAVGQKVSRGECVCILEAMKMANEVTAPRDGVVKEVRVSEGAIVNKGDVLAVIA
ncbi:biotin/lipoyl-binding protein [Candidatus Bathyarchaeota archaeon]|nr:biotin/lipoyl-binding protein [Candidatus Bathyarchaeota archaeon]